MIKLTTRIANAYRNDREVVLDTTALEKGDVVAYIEGSWRGDRTAYFCTVARVTGTMLVMEERGGTMRHYREDGSRVGAKGRRALLHPKDPEVLEAQQSMAVRALKAKVDGALKEHAERKITHEQFCYRVADHAARATLRVAELAAEIGQWPTVEQVEAGQA